MQMGLRRLAFCLFFLSLLLCSFAKPKKIKTKLIQNLPPIPESPCSIPNNGFKSLQKVGKKLSEECEVVVLSSTLLNTDPFKVLNTTEEGLCFVFFSDNGLNLPENCTSTNEQFVREGVIKCGGWWVVMEDPDRFPFSNPILNTKVLKTHLHLFFPYAKILGWIDGDMIPLFTLKDVYGLFENNETVIALPPRLKGGDFTIRNESEQVEYDTVSPRSVKSMMKMYSSLGWADLPVLHGGFRFQRNVEITRRFSCDWFAEIEAWANRDQLSLSPMLHKMEIDMPPSLRLISLDDTKRYFWRSDQKAHPKNWARQQKISRREQPKNETCEGSSNMFTNFPSQDTDFTESDHFQRARQYIQQEVSHIHTGLDLGAGIGSFAAVSDRLWGLSVTSLDLETPEFPFHCAISARGAQFPAVMWDKHATPYPLLTGLFDLIHARNFPTSSGPMMKNLAWEWDRLLSPNGVLIISSTMSASVHAAFVTGMEENSRKLVVNERLDEEESRKLIDPVHDYFIVFIGTEGEGSLPREMAKRHHQPLFLVVCVLAVLILLFAHLLILLRK